MSNRSSFMTICFLGCTDWAEFFVASLLIKQRSIGSWKMKIFSKSEGGKNVNYHSHCHISAIYGPILIIQSAFYFEYPELLEDYTNKCNIWLLFFSSIVILAIRKPLFCKNSPIFIKLSVWLPSLYILCHAINQISTSNS